MTALSKFVHAINTLLLEIAYNMPFLNFATIFSKKKELFKVKIEFHTYADILQNKLIVRPPSCFIKRFQTDLHCKKQFGMH